MDLAWVSSPVWLIINALMAFRLTRLWIDDSLPPLPRLRAWADQKLIKIWDRKTDAPKYETHDLERWYGAHHPLWSLFTCYWCAGFWISLGVTLAASLIPPTAWTLLAVPLALSALIGLLGRLD